MDTAVTEQPAETVPVQTDSGTDEQAIQEQPKPNTEGVTVEQPKASTNRVVRPVCQLAKAQAPIQACCRPGMWCPGVRNLHMARETWAIQAEPDVALDKLVEAVEGIDKVELMEVHKVDKSRRYVEIFTFTEGCNWLDVVEVTFSPGDNPADQRIIQATDPAISEPGHTDLFSGTSTAETVSFSSGLFPAWCPLTFLCNCCCFYAPFSGNGQNTRRLELLRNALKFDITVTAETKCNCAPS